MFKILVCFFAVSLLACSTTIGNKADLNSVQFAVNQTKKSEVANQLGLPSKISKNEKDGKEYWYYTKGAKLTGIMIATPDATTATASTHSISVGSAMDEVDYAALFVFDKDDVLIEVHR